MQRPIFIADHSERLLCPLPLKIEPYSGCSGHCAYCSRAGLRDPGAGRVEANSVKYVEKYFFHSKKCMERELIEQRSPVQIGPASDPLQAAEREAKVTLRILKILADRQYPTILTSKFPDVLTRPEYLRALDGLPLVVQCSICSADVATLAALEPGAPPLSRRLEALRTLHEAGVYVQLRLWPLSDLSGNVGDLLRAAKASGVKTVLANLMKVYHSGGPEGINRAIEQDYFATTQLHYVNAGLFSVPCYRDQLMMMRRLFNLCRLLDLDLLSCDDLIKSRRWRSCCGTDDLPGFEGIAKWAYYTNGYRIKDHCTFNEYMKGHNCPWRSEYETEWNKGKLARALPGLIFHPEDLTYSCITL